MASLKPSNILVAPPPAPFAAGGAPPPAYVFPVPALGPSLSAAAAAFAQRTQAPLELVAHHFLTLAAMMAQRLATLRLPTGQERPLSCYFLTVAGPAERKSAVEEAVVDPVRARYMENRIDARLEDDEVWQRFWTPPMAQRNRYHECRGQYGLFARRSDEVIADGPRRLEEATSLCALWDGNSEIGFEADAYVPRLSLHLVSTPRDAARLLGDPGLADTGLIGRFLPALPTSRVGFRRIAAAGAVETSAAYDDFTTRLLASFAADDTAGSRLLALSADAEVLWFDFAAEVEAAMAPGGPLAPIVGFAGRLPEHAARLAGVIALAEDAGAAELGADDLRRGIDLARFYALETLRIEGVLAPADGARAEALLDWLRRRRAGRDVCLRDVCRGAPKGLRNGDVAYRLMWRLERLGAVKPAGDAPAPHPAHRRPGIAYEWHVPADAPAAAPANAAGQVDWSAPRF